MTMDNYDTTASTFKTGTKYGVILGVGITVLTIILLLTGLQDFIAPDNLWLPTVLTIIIFIACTYLGIREFKEHNELLLSLGDAMITSLYIGLISAIVGGILTILYYHLADPEIYDRMTDFFLEFTVGHPNASADETEIMETKQVFGYIFSPFVIFISSFTTNLMFAVVIGLILGLKMRTD